MLAQFSVSNENIGIWVVAAIVIMGYGAFAANQIKTFFIKPQVKSDDEFVRRGEMHDSINEAKSEIMLQVDRLGTDLQTLRTEQRSDARTLTDTTHRMEVRLSEFIAEQKAKSEQKAKDAK